MDHLHKNILLLFCFTLVSLGLLQAQQARNVAPVTVKSKVISTQGGGSLTPVWKENMPVSSRSNPQVMIQAPYFEGAGFDRDLVNLPYYEVLVPVNENQDLTIGAISPQNVKEETDELFAKSVKEMEIQPGDDYFPAKHVVLGPRVIRNKAHFRVIQVYPIIVSADGHSYLKAESVSWSLSRKSLSPREMAKYHPANKTQATSSVLSSGTWYKIGVTEEGVYRLDYNFLSNLGIDMNNLDPRKIRVFGNGGGMLPQTVGDFRHDDLVENKVYVSGESDGSFDANDYLIFYGASPHAWKYVSSLGRVAHFFNCYADTNFYFLNIGQANGDRIQETPSQGGVTQTPTYVTNYAFHEQDEYNSILSGRVWLGETFDFTTSRDYQFSVPNLAPGTNLDIIARVGARSAISRSKFTITADGKKVFDLDPPTVNPDQYADYYYRTDWAANTFAASNVVGSVLDVNVSFAKANVSAIGWLDFLEVIYKSQLKINTGSAFWFSAVDGFGAGEVFQYNITNAGGGETVWNVSDPVNVQKQAYTTSGSTISFAAKADTLSRFVVFTANDHKTPVSARSIGNQDLHGLSQADMLIISHPMFLSQANTLAEFHRNQLGHTVHVANINHVWNEFASGRMDPTAIRDFIHMFYARSTSQADAPKYVLLFGDGSYDYKDRVATGITNFIPTYQSRKSQRPTDAYTSDDYFGFLDDGEGFWGENAANEGGDPDILGLADGDNAVLTHYLDVSIGRLPAGSVTEANVLVDKIINYANNPVGFGPWRNRLLLVADHKDLDGNIHIKQADSYSGKIYAKNKCINIDKVFLDNYDQVNTANGVRHPDAKDELITRLDEGALIVNYTGHGGETGWSNSKILEVSDIQNLSNGYNLPAFVTATCEFGRFDDPDRQSAAEKVLVQDGGGSIAMFTTVRVVYSGPNFYLNTNFYDYAISFDSSLGRMPTLGEIFMKTKNASWLGGINNRFFTLMGDPGLTLNYPKLKGVITAINGSNTVNGQVDSLPSLSLVTLEGEVRDDQGNFLSTFNGDLSTIVFDKPAKFITKRAPYTFYWQKNKIFNGDGTITNGKFTIQFVVPIDISYENGLGKISLYFHDNVTDGGGCDCDIYVGGTGNIVDDQGPELDVFMNDEKWADGGLVGPDPLMLVKLFDENGINTVGTGIGHELTGILDDDEQNVLILNDYYTASKNSYQEGYINYPFQDLAVGEHKVHVKVWDVANNSAEGGTTFIVADDAEMALGHVLNYPNPFTTHTKFYIEHNRNGSFLDIQVKIFTVSGKLVKSLDDSIFAEGNLYCDMEWDGLDDYGDKIGRGVYVYQVFLKDHETGEKVSKFEKLVLLR
ncbi:MAG: type IX secretion system sortase PorU [Bacteroidia bacterium]|nr:type IX secretion system sortase PorU [Bacteroidia bacterium]